MSSSRMTGLAPLAICLVAGIFCGLPRLSAQIDHLPIDHPATTVLLRLARAGVIPEFPSEHLPITRRDGLRWIERALADSSLEASLRRDAEWYRVELAADGPEGRRAVVIPIADADDQVFSSIPFERPFTGIAWYDTARDARILLDPVLDADLRHASGTVEGSAVIAQGGVRLRGSIRSLVGFSATATNGTVLGDEAVALDDPLYSRTFKFGQVGQNRDVDFGRAHARVDIDGAALEIGRERVRLGVGGESTLLFGADLPSQTDYLRMAIALGPFDYTHLHASLIAEGETIGVGPDADIPTKYLAAHLLSVGPVAGMRLSVGEAVIYGGRPFEIGYLNPFNFLKSQEHFLRDRDNSFLYAALRAWPIDRLMVEGEFMLDDLIFSRIGTGWWGNKSAWRVGATATGFPVGTVDLSAEYTRLEPYVYTHFAPQNAYLHDGANPAAGGLQPNSYRWSGVVAWQPLPALRTSVRVTVGEHGRNVLADTGIVRNVGGDVATGFIREVSSESVVFLDGILEKTTGVDLVADYEVMRNVYLRLRGFLRSQSVDGEEGSERRQMWFGLRVGSR